MAVTLDIDGTITGFKAKTAEAKEELRGLASGYDEVKEASQRAITGAVSGQKNLADSTKKTGKELNTQGTIVTKLEAHLKRLEKGQKKTNDPKLIKKYNTEIAKTRAVLAGVRSGGAGAAGGLAAVNSVGGASIAVFTALRGVLATVLGPLAAGLAGIEVLRNVVGLVNEYEQTAADLQAITGANDETLNFLKQSAVEVGVETTVSAGKTLEAYKLIASAKPELLSNAEGLAQITREAITLTEAMGGDLPTAATNLTDVMNQFNAPASEASRFVNALAAGSKEGSADVQQLADAILVAGTEAKASNVSFEESVGLTEALAEKGKKGAEAGTALRNIFSKLSATDILPKEATERLLAAGVDIEQLSDKSLTFTQRLEALKPVQNDANALTAVFGLENKSTAQILLGNINRVNELTEAVTDTNVAQEQAAIRTATASAEWARLKNTLSAVVQENGGGLSSLLAFLISFVRQGVLGIKEGIDFIRPSFSELFGAVRSVIDVFRNLLPAQDESGKKFNILGTIIKLVLVPILAFTKLLTTGVTIFANSTKAVGAFIRQSEPLNALFNRLLKNVRGFVSVFLDLPSYISGGLASISTFVVESAASIGRLGKNAGKVLAELFNVKKLVTQGRGDLLDALDDLLVTPFKGVGTKARAEFEKAFNISRDGLKIAPPKVDAPAIDNQGQPEPEATTPAFSRAGKDAEKEAEKEAKEAARRAREISKAKVDALKDGIDKELALETLRYDDLKSKLDKFGIDSSEATLQHELNKLKIRQKYISELNGIEDLNGADRAKAIYDQTKKEIAGIEQALSEGGGSLTSVQQNQINILRKKANEEYLKDLKTAQTKEQKEKEQHEINLLELQRGSFDTQAEFEDFKQKEILDIRLKFAEKQLEIIEALQGAESDAALSIRKTINEIKGELSGLSNLETGDFNIFKLFGLDPESEDGAEVIKGISVAADTAREVLTEVNRLRLESAQAAIDAADEEIQAIQNKIEAKQSELEEEQALSEEGFSSREEAITNDLALLKSQQAAEKVERDKALAEKKKIQKQQAIVDTITQASSLITAAAQVFQSVAGIPFVGPVLGAGLVAAMIGSFIAAKAKVFSNISKQKAERGMVGIVRGNRHSDGGEAFGDHIEVEDGEAFGVLSRSATKKYGKIHKAFINAMNKGKSLSEVGKIINLNTRKENTVIELREKENNVVNLNNQIVLKGKDNESTEKDQTIKDFVSFYKGQEKVSFSGGKKIIKVGNTTRIVKIG